MTNFELIDRYVYAVTKQLPISMRSDVDKELRSIIADMLEERCGDMAPSDKDVRVVLTELGTTEELALKYDPMGEKYLISPRLYSTYIRVLATICISVAGGLAIAGVVSTIFGDSVGPWYLIIAEWASAIFNTLLTVFTVTTIVFAIVDRKASIPNAAEELSKLPAVPAKKELISRGESIFGIVFNAVFLILFAAAPQVLCGVLNVENGVVEAVTMFNNDVLAGLWGIWGAMFLAGIVKNILGLVIGRHCIKSAITATCCNIASVVSAGLFFLHRGIINEALITELRIAGGNAVDVAGGLTATGFGAIIFAILAVLLVIDTAEHIYKGIRYSKN